MFLSNRKKKHILTDINWSIPDFKGIIGIIGPNGAGKTTLIHSIIGLRPISSGHIKKKAGLRIAYCPDVPAFDPYLTVTEVLQQIYQLETGGTLSVERSQQILQGVNLAEASDKQTRFLSRGMLQRLAIGTVVVSEPEIAIFDEPTSALDIEGQVEIMQLLQHFSEKCPVLLSSHNLYDIQQYAKEIIVINKGKLAFNGKTSDFQKGNSGQFAFSSNDEQYLARLATNISSGRCYCRDGVLSGHSPVVPLEPGALGCGVEPLNVSSSAIVHKNLSRSHCSDFESKPALPRGCEALARWD